MKHYLGILFLLFLALVVQAQEQTISGTITDASDGLSIPGVSIVVKGTTNGTITDLDGKFNLTASLTDVLIFSFIGYETQEVAVTAESMEIALSEANVGLSELVVVGYGTQSKKDLTGAVSIVDNKTIEAIQPVKVEQALQGTTAGVNVTAQSGAPGSGLDIRIRGISTNGNAAPVAIIDGYQGDLSLLNPDDIETITVLKDAQAAIYGTVGANGIILVTTKKGKKNSKAKVTLNTSVGMQETTRTLPLLNATEYAVLLNESYAANGQTPPFNDITGLGVGTKWQDEIFETAPVYNTSISLSGGSENVTYNASVSNLDQKGIVGKDKTGYTRNTAKIGVGADLNDFIKLNSYVMYTDVNRASINENGLGSVLFNAVNMPATITPFDSNNDYTLAPANLGIEIINPLAQIANTHNEYVLSKFNGNFGLEFQLAEYLTANARVGFNTSKSRSKDFSKIVDYGGKVFDKTRSSVFQEQKNDADYTFDAFVTYANTFNDVHKLTATLGTTVFKTWGNALNGTGFDVPNNSWEFADIGLANGLSESKTTGSWVYDQRRLSYFARAEYSYNRKYLFSGMLRRDASTKFGPENAVAYFPSVTAGWIITEENFMQDVELVDFLKLRASYGLLGNDQIPDYQYISQLNGEATYVLDGAIVDGRAVGSLPNPKAKWEQSEQLDIGLDLYIFNSKVTITTDYFEKTTNDLLIPEIPVSGILGTSAPGAAGPTINAGTVKNSGFEFAIGYNGEITEDLKFGINYNITTLKNEVLKVNNGTGFIEGGEFGVGQPAPSRMEVGLPIGYFYGYKTDGIFQSQAEVDAHPSQLELGAEAKPGDIRYADVNGDGEINTDDRTNIGDPIPAATMGLNVTLNYKGFDFLIYAYSSIGNDMVRNYERAQPNVNRLTKTMDRWTGAGTSNWEPRLTTAATANSIFSNYFVEDASFIRIQNVQLGYTFPARWMDKVKIERLRLFAGVLNPFTFTNYTGFDPAASSGDPIGSGIDYGFYPAARTYTLGLNLKF